MTDPSRNGNLTAGQRALAGYRLTKEGKTNEQAAAEAGSTVRQIQAVKYVLGRVPEFEDALESGELTLNAATVGSGYRSHKPISEKPAFGKGDKWVEIANMLSTYLATWKNRDYKFVHVPPKEAAYRVKKLDKLIEGLQQVRADLEARSVKATSSLGSK